MLELKLGTHLPSTKVTQFLRDNCDGAEPVGYTRQFTPDEMDAMKDNLAEVSIDLNDLDIEKKELVKEFKDKMKPLDKTRKVLLENIRKKSEYINAECFKFIDHEDSIVGFYDGAGSLVSQRRIKPDERQTKMFTLEKTGTES